MEDNKKKKTKDIKGKKMKQFIILSIYLRIRRTADVRATCGQGCDSGGQSQLPTPGRVRRTLISTGCTGHGCT